MEVKDLKGYKSILIDINGNLEVVYLSQKEIEFAVFCVENIADYLKMNAQDIYQLLGVKSRLLLCCQNNNT